LNGPYGGQILGIGESRRTETLVAASLAGGVVRSTDHGETWSNTSLVGKYCQESAIDTEGTIYVATYYDGLFRSTDDGRTWDVFYAPTPYASVLSVATDLQNRVYAGTLDGLFRSDASGLTWSRLDSGFSFSEIQQISVAENGYIFIGVDGAGLLRSTDDGKSWEARITNPDQMTSLVITPGSEVYVSFISGNILRSTDDGETWSSLSTGLPTSKVRSLCTVSDSTVLVGTNLGVFRRNPRTASWELRGLEHTTTVALIETQQGIILAGTFKGVFRSTDSTGNWMASSVGLCATSPNVFLFKSESHFYACTFGGDVLYESTDGGDTWSSLGTLIERENGQAILSSRSRTLFFGADNVLDATGSLFRSSDSGGSWSDTVLPSCDVASLALAKDGSVFAAGGYRTMLRARLYRSTDDGTSWDLILSMRGYPFRSVVIDSSGNVLVASDSGMYRSTDNGVSWAIVNSGLDGNKPRCLAVLCNDKVVAGTTNGVYYLPPGSGTWQHLGLTDVFVKCLAVNRTGDIFAGSDGSGVYVSSDTGRSWIERNTGLLNGNIMCIGTDSRGYIYAGTGGNGVFKSAHSTESVGGENPLGSLSFGLAQNFPNPFNPVTRILYDVPRRSQIRLTLHDILGRELLLLVDEIQQPGRYGVDFMGKGYSSGVYIYRLQSAGVSLSRKMLLLK
jgi:photosystem II stability/assembly factor-like uncharacterized protein